MIFFFSAVQVVYFLHLYFVHGAVIYRLSIFISDDKSSTQIISWMHRREIEKMPMKVVPPDPTDWMTQVFSSHHS